MSQFAYSTEAPWMLARDFNETQSLAERDHGGSDLSRRCTLFANRIENNGLIDFGFSGHRFTWVRGNTCETRKSARLDRALCNTSWRARFPEASVRHLLRCYSDHCPYPHKHEWVCSSIDECQAISLSSDLDITYSF